MGLRYLLYLGFNLATVYLLGNHSTKTQARHVHPAPMTSKFTPEFLQLSYSVEGQGSFINCYSIFKYVFFHYLLGTFGAYFSLSLTVMWIVWKIKTSYDYILEPLKKPPDRRTLSRAPKRLLVALVLHYLRLQNMYQGLLKAEAIL